jgi:hypothetical protein
MKSSTSSSGHLKSYLNYCNCYIKIGLVSVKPSRRTTFGTTLLFCNEFGSVLSLDEVTKSPCPYQVVSSAKSACTALGWKSFESKLFTGNYLGHFRRDSSCS